MFRNVRSGNTETACPAVLLPHNTQTGRWLTPFRAVFDPKDPAEAAVVVGNMGYGVGPRRWTGSSHSHTHSHTHTPAVSSESSYMRCLRSYGMQAAARHHGV